MKILGVDLGTYSIKIAELDASSKSFVINNFIEIPLSMGPGRDKTLQIIEALRGLSVKYDSNTRWVVGVPQHMVSVRHKRFPFRERAKINKSLAFELEDEIPLDIDETVFDYKMIEFVGPAADVLTIACPVDVIEETLQIAKDGGFDPEIVSVEGLALANIFENWNSAPPEVSPSLRNPDESTSIVPATATRARLVLHLGHSRSLLLVYRDGGLVAVRSILWGGGEIADAIARTFNLPIYEAVKILTEKSFILMNSAGATRDQIKLSQTIADQVDNLLKDLKLTLLEVKAAFGLEFERVDLMGGASQIQNLGAYITQGLEIPANLNTEPVREKPTRAPFTPHLEATAAVAIGLAIEGLKRPRNPAVNLRKGDLARENLTLKRFWQTWRVPAQIAVAAFALFFVYSIARDQIASGLISTADERLTEAAQKAAMLKGAAANESGLRKYITTQKNRIKNFEALSQLDDYVNAMDIIARISEKLPGKAPVGQGIDVSLVDLDNDDLTVKGKASTPLQVAVIEKALTEIARPKTLTKIQADGVPPGGAPFGFKMKVNRK